MEEHEVKPLLVADINTLAFCEVVRYAERLSSKYKRFVVYAETYSGVIWIHVNEDRWAVFNEPREYFERFKRYVMEEQMDVIIKVNVTISVERMTEKGVEVRIHDVV